MNKNEVWILEEIPESNLDIKGSGDMNQSIRTWVLVSSTHVKRQVWQHTSATPALGRGGRWVPTALCLALSEWRDPPLKKHDREWVRETQCWPLVTILIHVHTHTHVIKQRVKAAMDYILRYGDGRWSRKEKGIEKKIRRIFFNSP